MVLIQVICRPNGLCRSVGNQYRLDWKEAKAEAEASMGGTGLHLATFTSDDDWDNMLSEVGIENISSNHTWLGATDEMRKANLEVG